MLVSNGVIVPLAHPEPDLNPDVQHPVRNEGDTMRMFEDAVWTYFGYPNAVWAERCTLCRGTASRTGKPCAETLSCWHLELWEHGKLMRSRPGLYPTFQEACTALIEILQNLGLFSTAKLSRGNIKVIRTGEPADGYPSLGTDRLLILYALSERTRDAIKNEMTRWAKAPGGECLIPVRRGCWGLEDMLGDWRKWNERASGVLQEGTSAGLEK